MHANYFLMKKIIFYSFLAFALSSLASAPSFAAETSCALKKKSAYTSSASDDVYYITDNCTKQIFPNESVFFMYFNSWNNARLVDDLTLRFIPNDPEKYVPAEGGTRSGESTGNSGSNSSSNSSSKNDAERAVTLIVRDGSIIKTKNENNVYIVINNVKFHIENMETLRELGIPLRWIEVVTQKTIDALPSGASLNVYMNTKIMSQATPDFMLLKDKNSADIYRVEPSTRDPKYQVLRKISNEAALRKTGYRLDRIPEVKIEKIPDLSLIGIGSKTVFYSSSDLTSNTSISYRSKSEDLINEKRGAKNEGAYLRNEKYEGISYEYPWKYRALRGFSYSSTFRDEYMVSFVSQNDENAALYLMITPISGKSSSYTKAEQEELINTAHEQSLRSEFPELTTVRRSSSEIKRHTTYGYTKITNLEFHNGAFQRRITFIYKNQIFSGIVRYVSSSSSADLEDLLYFIASTFKKN